MRTNHIKFPLIFSRFILAIKWLRVIDYENELRKLKSSDKTKLMLIFMHTHMFETQTLSGMLKLSLGLKFHR